MPTTSAIAETAAIVGDPARASMLATLMDGRSLTAGELARAAGVTPQTASLHLARLTTAGLLQMSKQGRHRYHQLASPAVAQMLEAILSVSAATRTRLTTGPRDAALRHARTCYDHLAGEVAVAIADRLQEGGQLDMSPDGGVLTDSGAALLLSAGVDLDGAERKGRRPRVFCRACLDWSERRAHIAGAVGTSMCQAFFRQGWIRRIEGSRAVQVTPAGQREFRRLFELRP